MGIEVPEDPAQGCGFDHRHEGSCQSLTPHLNAIVDMLKYGSDMLGSATNRFDINNISLSMTQFPEKLQLVQGKLFINGEFVDS